MDKFESLCGKIVDLLKAITSVPQLEEAVAILHRKIVTDAKFVPMYAALVQSISTDLKPLTDTSTAKPVQFRSLLLNKCQARVISGDLT